jgi:hypothetical protein
MSFAKKNDFFKSKILFPDPALDPSPATEASGQLMPRAEDKPVDPFSDAEEKPVDLFFGQ